MVLFPYEDTYAADKHSHPFALTHSLADPHIDIERLRR